MGRLFTNCLAAMVGLVIAFALAMPGLKAPPPAPPGVEAEPAVAENAPPATEPPGTPPATEPPGTPPADNAAPAAAPPLVDNQTILAASIASGSAEVTLNGRPVGTLQGGKRFDVSPYAHPGENRLHVTWTCSVSGDIHVTHATRAGEFRDVAGLFLVPVDTLQPGARTVSFYL